MPCLLEYFNGGHSGLCANDEDAEIENSRVEKVLRPTGQGRNLPQQNEVSTSEGVKESGHERVENDMNERNVDSLEEVVKQADDGKAGICMAQIVGIWIGQHECHALVHLISQCLSKSLNQVSLFKVFVGDVPAAESEGSGLISSGGEVWLCVQRSSCLLRELQMVRVVYTKTRDLTLPKRAFPILLKEHAFWTSVLHEVRVRDKKGKEHRLSRFWAH